MNIKILSKSFAANLILIEDHKKAAQLMFQMIENSFEHNETEKESVKDYLIRTIEVINEHDQRYADQIAIEYLRLLNDQFL